MIKFVLLFVVLTQLAWVEAFYKGSSWNIFKESVCDKWCFNPTACIVPAHTNCTRCLANACGTDFANPFSTNFGLSCIDTAVFGWSRPCASVCPQWTSARSHACKDCLKPCIKSAEKSSLTYCPSDPWGYRDNCVSCMNNNTSCPTSQEIFALPKFCRDYIKISCGELPNPYLDRELNSWNVTCVKTAWEDKCSKCPAFSAARWGNCGTCMDNCKASIKCSKGCNKGGNMRFPAGEIKCAHCKALCAANTKPAADCVAVNCPDCATCNNCISSCKNQKFIDNHCECVERRYNYLWH